jgi:predicted RNase H-like HicB family nuclease
MTVYHVIVEREDDWYVARALEDSAVFTQGRSFDEIIANIREVSDLLHGHKDVQIELVIPPEVGSQRRPGRRVSQSKSRPSRPRAGAGTS